MIHSRQASNYVLFGEALCNFAREVPIWERWEDSFSHTEGVNVETSDGCFLFV